MMASAALRAVGKEFDSLYSTIESLAGGQVFEEDSYEDQPHPNVPGSSAVALLRQWELEQKALLDMKSLLHKAKTTSAWPDRGESKPLGDQVPSGRLRPLAGEEAKDRMSLDDATPPPAKKKRRTSSRGQQHSSSIIMEDVQGQTPESESPAAIVDLSQEEGSDQNDGSSESDEEGSSNERDDDFIAHQDAEAALRRSSRAATPVSRGPSSPARRTRGVLTPSKRTASERGRGERTTPSRSSLQRAARSEAKDSTATPEPEPRKESFPCPVKGCRNSFGSTSTRNCHLNMVHPSEAHKHLPFSCSQCPYACGARSTMENHMKSVHKGSQ